MFFDKQREVNLTKSGFVLPLIVRSLVLCEQSLNNPQSDEFLDVFKDKITKVIMHDLQSNRFPALFKLSALRSVNLTSADNQDETFKRLESSTNLVKLEVVLSRIKRPFPEVLQGYSGRL